MNRSDIAIRSNCQEESLSANNPRFIIYGVAQVLQPSFLAIITRLVTHSSVSI